MRHCCFGRCPLHVASGTSLVSGRQLHPAAAPCALLLGGVPAAITSGLSFARILLKAYGPDAHVFLSARRWGCPNSYLITVTRLSAWLGLSTCTPVGASAGHKYVLPAAVHTGDQTLFCRACDFKSVGGFDARWPIMEDTDLCVRLHHAGPCRHSSAAPAPAPAIATAPASRGAQQVAGNPQKQRQQQQQDEHRWQSMQQQWQQWLQPRGRIRQVLDRVSVTSSRRVEAWGPLKATYIHFTIGLSWYFKQDPTLIRQLYDKLYTDAFR